MKRSEQSKQQPTIPANHPGRIWLLGGVFALLLLTAAVMLFAPRILTSPSLKQKIQTAITGKTDGRLDYQEIALCYFPQPGIELQGVSLAFPEQVQGTIARIRILPKLIPLLTGDLHLSSLGVDEAQLSITLPDAKPVSIPAQSLSLTALKENLAGAGKAMGLVPSGSKVTISNAQLSLIRSKQKLATIAGLNLQVKITSADSSSTEGGLKMTIAELMLYRQDRRESLANFGLGSSFRISDTKSTVTLNQLTLGEPNLALTGELIFAATEPNLTLNMSGSNIDVDASRATAMALAGDTTPVKQIFNYLRGGRVPQITFSTHGTSLSELGKLDNILIKGQLQDGKISVPEINLELTEVLGDVLISDGILQGSKLSTRWKNSSGKDGSLQIGLTKGNDLFLLELPLVADLNEVYPWLSSQKGLQDQLPKMQQMSGQIDMSALKLHGKLNKPSAWKISSAGSLSNISIAPERFPDTINLASGRFTMTPGQLSLEKLELTSQTTTLSLSGNVQGFPRQVGRIDLTLNGRIGSRSFAWLSNQIKLPESYLIHTPLNISNSKLSWQPGSSTSFKGLVMIENGPAITAEVDYSPNRLQIHQLTVKDDHSDATMVFDLTGARRDGKFTGRLRHETLQSIFVNTPFNIGELAGDLALSVPQTGQGAVTAKGQLTGDKLPIVLTSGDKLDIDQILLQGAGPEIRVDIARMTWKYLSYAPFKAIVSRRDRRTDIKVVEARLCGIDSPGTISTIGDSLSIDMTFTGHELDVTDSYTCLTGGSVKMTGSLEFSSRITGKGQADRLVNAIQGPLQVTLTNGVIEQDKLFAKTLETINNKEIFKSSIPKLTSSGFIYNTITVQGRFHNGILTIDKYFMDGKTLNLIGAGEINLEERTITMQLLAVPFQTVNNIVKSVPGVNYLLADGLVSIPVSISGSLTDPKVSAMHVAGVSTSLANLAKQTIKSPFKLIETLNPMNWKKAK